MHGEPPEFDDYLRKHGLRLHETDRQSYCHGKGGLEPCEGLESGILKRLNKMSPADFPDESFEQTLVTRFAGVDVVRRRRGVCFPETQALPCRNFPASTVPV